jgi:hypothetical protein
MPRGNPEYITYLFKGDDVIEIHVFTCEPTEKHNPYRAITSMSWFSERESKRNYDALVNGKPILFHLGPFEKKKWHDDTEARWKASCEKSGHEYEPLLPGVPTFTHESLWDMYTAVGYDHKTKKWVRENV